MPTSQPRLPPTFRRPQPKWQAWIRGGGSDLSYDVDKGWDFDQTAYGLQGGADYTFDYNASRISFGAFGGYGWSKADVHDTFFYGWDNTNLDIEGWNAGIYATFRQVGGLPGTGWYVDLVGKVDVLDVDMNGDVDGDGIAFKAKTDATAWGGSAEVGYGFDLGNGFVVQPQGQLTYVNVSQDSYTTSSGIFVSAGRRGLAGRSPGRAVPDHGGGDQRPELDALGGVQRAVRVLG